MKGIYIKIRSLITGRASGITFTSKEEIDRGQKKLGEISEKQPRFLALERGLSALRNL